MSIDKNNGSGVPDGKARAEYTAPVLTTWGTVADLTRVGQTNPGNDMLPGQARGLQFGSVNADGL